MRWTCGHVNARFPEVSWRGARYRPEVTGGPDYLLSGRAQRAGSDFRPLVPKCNLGTRRPDTPTGWPSYSPRLARQRLPWVHAGRSNPERVEANRWPLTGFNPYRVGLMDSEPRVARSEQPWAIGSQPRWGWIKHSFPDKRVPKCNLGTRR